MSSYVAQTEHVALYSWRMRV